MNIHLTRRSLFTTDTKKAKPSILSDVILEPLPGITPILCIETPIHLNWLI